MIRKNAISVDDTRENATPFTMNEHCFETLIRPPQNWFVLRWQEWWEYRELLYFLVWRDIKVRYKQTVMGSTWAILQPLLGMIVFSFFFGKLAKIPSDGLPYPVFVYAALLPWTFFVNGLTQGSNSLVGNSNLVTKVYFPRVMIPVASVFSGLLDFAIAFVLLIALNQFYRIPVTINVIWAPLLLLLVLLTTIGVGLWFSALNVRYRDVRYVVAFLTQLWFFLTPIAYPSSFLEFPWRIFYGLNPMVGVVEGFRWVFLNSAPSHLMLGVSTITAIGIFLSGLFYFQKMEETFADEV